MKNSRLLIDGDILAYRTCWAVQSEVEWEDGIVTTDTNLEELYSQAEMSIEIWKEKLEIEDYEIAFSDPKGKYFRHDIFPDYKGNRKGGRKPLGYKALVKYLQSTRNSQVLPLCEADDVLGILATNGTFDRNIIVSIDKDMLSIPGEYYNIDSGITLKISEKGADYMHLYQTLVGDSTDNYKGCPGIGPKKASAMLDIDPSWDTVAGAFQKAGLTEAEALVQAQVAKILRHEDYNFDLEEVILWKRPTVLNVVA